MRLRGHQLVLAERSDKKEKATFFLSANLDTKECLLMLRGTNTMHDVRVHDMFSFETFSFIGDRVGIFSFETFSLVIGWAYSHLRRSHW